MSKEIYCPECANRIYNYDGYSTTAVVVKCSYCKRYIKFNPLGMATKIVKNPEIRAASGARFW